MKLLFDQNLSFKLCALLADLFPGSKSVRELGLDKSDDLVIWQRAKDSDFVLVSQDSDFAEMAAHYGHPPKVIWLRCGNQPVAIVLDLLQSVHSCKIWWLYLYISEAHTRMDNAWTRLGWMN
jgi:predicted nuclease of predicted toxin-antitoxin system